VVRHLGQHRPPLRPCLVGILVDPNASLLDAVSDWLKFLSGVGNLPIERRSDNFLGLR
jgi:hypothetical protein